jgi:predicted GNAT family N-acyltransferase
MGASDSGPQPRIVIKVASNPEEMEHVFQMRDEVFVHEQHLTNDARFDPDDRRSIHYLAYLDDQPVGTGRLTMIKREAQVAWVAVRVPYRQSGIGKAVMIAILERARDEEADYVVLNAQSHALEFYSRLGFESMGHEFTMAGIPHQVMMLGLKRGVSEDVRSFFRSQHNSGI